MDVRVVGINDLGGNREPEASAAFGAASGVVESGESFEDPCVLLGCDAEAIVADLKHHRRSVFAERDGDGAGRVPHSVIDDVADGAT